MTAEQRAEIDQASAAAQPESKQRSAAKNGRPGPYSRVIDRGAVGGGLDGRSREGRFLRTYEAMLIKHVGGNPSIVQRALINRASRLALHLELLDERAFADGRGLGETDCHFYVAWTNALA